MQSEVWMVYFHMLAIVGTASFLLVEAVLCRPGLQGAALHRLKRVDIGYAVFAVAALITGATLVFHGAKGRGYYFANPVLHAKFTLFVLVGLISILPTVRFIQWSKAALRDASFAPADAAVLKMRRVLFIEIALLLLLPLLGVAIARGATSFGQIF